MRKKFISIVLLLCFVNSSFSITIAQDLVAQESNQVEQTTQIDLSTSTEQTTQIDLSSLTEQTTQTEQPSQAVQTTQTEQPSQAIQTTQIEQPAQVAASEVGVTEEQLDAARDIYFNQNNIPMARSLPQVEDSVLEIDNSSVEHLPANFLEIPKFDPNAPIGRNINLQTNGFAIGNVRDFYVDINLDGSYNTLDVVKGTVVAQSDHANVWVLDPQTFYQKLGVNPPANNTMASIIADPRYAQKLANEFDLIFNRMTNSATGFAEYKYFNRSGLEVGDLGTDGKINIVLQDIKGDGNISSSGIYGYFWAADYYNSPYTSNKLDMIYLDVGELQGYKKLTSSNDSEFYSFMGTLAHEFQHLLFYTYAGSYIQVNYPRNTEYNTATTWFNESLSGYADAFYSKEGKTVVDANNVYFVAFNDYSHGALGNIKIVDFLNFDNSAKNYAMGYIYSMFNHKLLNGKFPNLMYSHFANNGPSEDIIKDIGEVISKTEMSINGLTPEQQFITNYYLFIEALASDGGMLTKRNGSTVCMPKIMPIQSLLMNYNSYSDLWYSRNDLNIQLPYDTINNNDKKRIYAYSRYSNVTSPSATLEQMFKFGGITNKFLKVKINPVSTSDKYYVAIPNSDMRVQNADFSTGANIYTIKLNEENVIQTDNKEAFLFVVTYKQSLTTNPIEFSWSEDATITPPVVENNSQFEVKPGTKNQTIQIVSNTVLDPKKDKVSYALTTYNYQTNPELFNTPKFRWTAFRPKNNIQDNILKATAGLNLYMKVNDAPPMLVKTLEITDIQKLRSPSFTVKTMPHLDEDSAYVIFSKPYKEIEWGVTTSDKGGNATGVIEDGRWILAPQTRDEIFTLGNISGVNSLTDRIFARLKATELLPESNYSKGVKIDASTVGKPNTFISDIVIDKPEKIRSAVGKFKVNFTAEDGADIATSNLEYAIIEAEFDGDQVYYLNANKARWTKIRKLPDDQLLVVKNIKLDKDYVICLRKAKTGQVQPSGSNIEKFTTK